MEDLPPELIYEILLFLPVKSLLRFRCVSKSFYAIITSKDFINFHLNMSSEKRIHRNLIYRRDKKIYVSDVNNGFTEEFLLDFAMPLLRPRESAYCNGLLLILTTEFADFETDPKYFLYKFSIFNPSTRQYRELPAFPEVLVDPPYNPNYQRNAKLSFGYDPTTNDYKGVLIIFEEHTFQVWILELRSTCWRKINQDFSYILGLGRFDFDYGFDMNCFVNGCVHFLWRGNIGYPCIAAFDIAKETFYIVPQPNYRSEGNPLILQAFEGYLFIGFKIEPNVDFYVRKWEGDEFSWTKLFSFTTQLFSKLWLFRILGYSKEGDKVILSSYTRSLYWYDLKEGSLQEIEMTNIGGPHSILCTESLVSVYSLI